MVPFADFLPPLRERSIPIQLNHLLHVRCHLRFDLHAYASLGLLPSLHRIVVEVNIPSTPTTMIIWGRKPSDGLTKFPQLSIPKQVPMLPNQVVGSTYQTTSSDVKPNEINLPKDVARGLWGLGHNTHW